ncbi:MAG: restriction endonuclease [Alcanivorax sp.]
MGATAWMVRAAEGGRLADEFRDQNVVAIGWADLGDLNQYADKEGISAAIERTYPDWADGRKKTSASQLERFRGEPQRGDRVVTYDSSRRIYHLGVIESGYLYQPGVVPPFENIRKVSWQGEVRRDDLSVATRNRLGSTLTLFRIPDAAAAELEALLSGKEAAVQTDQEDEEQQESEFDVLHRYKEEAEEFIKDRVSRLSPAEMEELVAGLLRAMGYRTRVSPTGADRGVDILASPDGFGFESPRIMVEVKHRPNTAMGSQQLRAFLGGRHTGDKGLYVSTGGFTKDARYEAERAKIPLKLMDLGELVEALMEHYDNADAKARTLLPLSKLYWPV